MKMEKMWPTPNPSLKGREQRLTLQGEVGGGFQLFSCDSKFSSPLGDIF